MSVSYDVSFRRLSFVLLTGVLAVVFDTTIVNVALDTLGRDLHVTVGTIQWVTTGYLLALGVAVPVTGWLTDRLGGKRVWIAALFLFLAGSIGASLAGNAGALIGCRVVQGLGGGLMLPVMTTLIVQATGGRMLGRATALISFPALLGPILGPFAGGLIVQHLSWRWIFWVNVPFCVAGLLLAWRLLPAFPGTGRARLDLPGLALALPGIAAVVYGLSRFPSSYLPLALGAALLTAFTLRARRIGEAALVDVRLFRLRSFTGSVLLLFLSGFALYGALLLVPLYFQQVRGYGPLAAGLFIAAQGVGVLGSRSLAGRLTDRIGARWVAFAGLAVVAAATVPFAVAGATTGEWWLTGVLVVRGLGLGAVTIPVMAAAYQGLERTEVPHASILTRTAQQIGGSFGTAVLAVVLQHYATSHPLTTAFDIAFWWSIVCTVAALLLSLLLPARP
ncbi:MDR family MFS transporter [Actinoplanes sp. NPDC051343]|uniref:MDR family MFS transporter n=1 Tax=Actinoplanes sp. NPDC051343 TaxID=3363906 RepID=UPI0037A317E6